MKIILRQEMLIKEMIAMKICNDIAEGTIVGFICFTAYQLLKGYLIS